MASNRAPTMRNMPTRRSKPRRRAECA
jgi:hypothetical protein